MSVFFDASEVFQFAIRIEENGEKFYREVAEKSESDEIKELFYYLADEEVHHKNTFQGMLKKITDYKPSEAYPGEYFEYLRSYADELIFPKQIWKELDTDKGIVNVLDFGIRRELDAIMYYFEMKGFVPETQQKVLDKIIEEERRHFIKLSKIKQERLQK